MAPADIWTERRYFDKSCQYNSRYSTGESAQIKAACRQSISHLRTACMRGNMSWTRALQPDLEEVRSWRFCRAQLVRVWAPIFWWTHTFGAYILLGAEISTSALFLSYIMWRSNFTIPHRLDGNLCRIYFENPHLTPTFYANIWRQHLPQTFAAYICRLYFESPPIFWASANILCMCKYFRQVPIFDDFFQ